MLIHKCLSTAHLDGDYHHESIKSSPLITTDQSIGNSQTTVQSSHKLMQLAKFTPGALNFGLRGTCHQKDPTFLLAFTKRPPY